MKKYIHNHNNSYFCLVILVISIFITSVIFYIFNIDISFCYIFKVFIMSYVFFICSYIYDLKYDIKKYKIEINLMYYIFSVIYLVYILIMFKVNLVSFESIEENIIFYYFYYIFLDSITQGILVFIIIDSCLKNILNKQINKVKGYIENFTFWKPIYEDELFFVYKGECCFVILDELKYKVESLFIDINKDWLVVNDNYVFENDNFEKLKLIKFSLLSLNYNSNKNSEVIDMSNYPIIYPYTNVSLELEISIPKLFNEEFITNVNNIINLYLNFYEI